ncbi:MAG: protein BatD [Bacteroidia bacterium]|nr:protein BatD [Bacteroidia bacterium]
MRGLNKITFLFLISLLFLGKARAQVVTAQASSKQVQVGTPFDYAIVINTNANSYSAPNFNGLSVVGGPNQSTSMQSVNGQMSVQLTLSWNLVAPREGKFTIGTATVMAGQQKYETAPVTVEAVKGAVNQQPQSGGQTNTNYSSPSGADYYVRTSVDKPKCYIGEQITIVQKVYARNSIVGYKKYINPAYDGFYCQNLESPTKGQLVVENIDGLQYITHEASRTLATANKTGKITLTPVEGEIVIRRQTNAKPRNVFEQFFGAPATEDIPVVVKSRPITIEVLPLPEAGKPESFNGAVGNFSAKTEVTRNQLKANDAFNLKITISGKGNLKLLGSPPVRLPDGFESYEPKITEGTNSKTFDYLVIPRQEGDFTLDNIEFSFFNLDTKKYVAIPSGQIKIKVLPGDPNSQGTQVYSSQTQIKETENDIRYIKKGNFTLLKSDTEFFNSFMHLLLLAVPVLLLLTGIAIRNKHLKNNSNQVLVRERKAARLAKKQLLSAEKLAGQNKKDEFYTEILTALNNYLSHKLNIPVSDLSRDTVNKTLNEKQIEQTLLTKLLSTIETCEYAKYAPGAVSGDLQAVHKDTVTLITELEEKLNRKA